MCGLFGHTVVDRQIDLGSSRSALHTLIHRGPDQWSDWHDEYLYLGHRRLSILDLSENGRQPMIDKSAEGYCVALTANGEIWNYQNLKELLSYHCQFKSRSDSEVLLHGFKRWGLNSLLGQIDGMYAFTIYDQKNAVLHVVRDRYGVKPLYYAPPCTETGGRFIYASEIKAIFEFCPALRDFSRDGISDWLLHRGSYSGLTPYHGIHKLLPGHRIEVDVRTHHFKIHQYYELLDYCYDQPSDPNELDARFERAIQKRLIADVPLGVQLSGGVDSSLVACETARLAGKNVNSFSIGFEDEQKFSEENYAREAAHKCGLNHHQLNITRRDAAENFEHVLWLADGMLDYPNTIPIYMLSRYSRDFVTVQLTGEGADELFGGYNKFQNMAQLSRCQKFPLEAPDFVVSAAGMLKPELGRSLYLRSAYRQQPVSILNSLNSYISRSTVDSMFGSPASGLVDQVYAPGTEKRARFGALPFERQLILIDHKTYLHSILERQDRASMGASIEARVPFLDRGLVEWAVNLPQNSLFDQDGSKKILKQKSSAIFGHKFSYRKKMGFPVPLKSWMSDPQCLNGYFKKTEQKDFIFYEQFKNYREQLPHFDYVLLNYPDSEALWVNWFMMVLRNAQDRFRITGIK